MKNFGVYQLPLFDLSPTPLERMEKTNWSYSRRSTLFQCPRRYYYEYYGANKQVAFSEPLKEQLRDLKTLQNRYERTGALLHLMISQYFKKAQNGDPLSLERLQAWMMDLFQEDIRFSEATLEGSWEQSKPYPPTLLQEFYYRLPEAKQVCLEAGDRMLDGLKAFFQNKAFGLFRYHGSQKEALVEEPIRLPGLPCGVDGKVDLAYMVGEHIEVVDWKSGDYDAVGDESLQLAAYALWAKERFQCAIDKIKVRKVFLSSGDVVEFDVNEALLNAARARIIQDSEAMADLAQYGKRGIADAFTPCGHPGVCRLCSYRQVCPEGGKGYRA